MMEDIDITEVLQDEEKRKIFKAGMVAGQLKLGFKLLENEGG